MFRVLCLLTIVLFVTVSGLNADGKLLRGEVWQKFNYEGKKADFYVSIHGNDDWSGTLAEANAQKTDGPFATIERAMSAVRELKQKVYKPKVEPVEKRYIGSPHQLGEGKDILVYIRDGYYPLENPLEFTPDDGGERVQTNLPSGAFEYHKLKDHYVTYAAFPGEKPVILGGKLITSWQKRAGYWVSKPDIKEVKSLVADGVMQPLARTPNSGFFTPAELPKTKQSFKYRSGDVENWPNIEDNRIIMLLRWHTGHNSIARIDEKEQMIHLSEPQNGIVVVPPRYYIENVRALMDGPGEWYFDRKAGELSFIPPAGIEDPKELFCVTPLLDRILVISGNRERPVRNLRFYGLSFEGVNAGKAAINFEYAHNCELVDSKLKAMSGKGVVLGLGSYQNRILSNTITDISSSAISVEGQAHPEYWMDIIRETVISYNFIENTGGSSISDHNTLNSIISHNEVTNNHGRTAISIGGWRNLEEAITGGYRVEYNHVHHVQSRADDSGAITTSGMTYDSFVRNNLIHHVKAGYFNNNVAIWFDNMSLGWTAEDNILYNLEQDDMKLCACNLVDNHYHGNFHIKPPLNEPEGIIAGEPDFVYSDLQVGSTVSASGTDLITGDYIQVSAKVTNNGATGIQLADLYVDGKREQTKKFPVVHNNSRTISFETRFVEPGEHKVAISTTFNKIINLKGDRPPALYDSLSLSSYFLPAGEEVVISAVVENVQNDNPGIKADLVINNEIVETRELSIEPGISHNITFRQNLDPGLYKISVGNTPPLRLEVYPHYNIDIATVKMQEFCSGTANPCSFDVDQKANRFQIETAGTDFMHGEDSYGTAYLKEPIKGNFVATVKVKKFGNRTHQWFRAGLFVRNDMEKSFDTGDASLGSVLWFVTPGRVGMNWDRYGNGAMHWASSENHHTMDPDMMWIKLVRHGNSFIGYISYDGKNWTVSRQTEDIPGIAEAVHLGLATGGPDERIYMVEFEDFQVQVEEDGWKLR